MPILVGILALCVMFLIFGLITNNDKQAQKNETEEARLKALEDSIQNQKITLEDLEKRVLNIEDIVTDVKFEETPTTGREAINLKAEMNELKTMLINLKK